MTKTRTLHLIDIENLTCGYTDGELASKQFDLYLQAAGYRPGDLGYIASNASLCKNFAWHVMSKSSFRYLLSPAGPDAADHDLIDSFRHLDLGTFSALVVGSGDGIFAEAAHDAVEAGLRTMCVANNGTISAVLRYFSDEVVELPRPLTVA